MTGTSGAPLTPQTGMEVFTADAGRVGTVKSVDPPVMHVSRQMRRDIYIPLDFVAQVLADEARVELNLTEEEMGDMEWQKPPLAGS